ncbi:hypothetical protein MNBD_NITROSPIRAE03-1133, partial [hydrothermal vent metagenome]
QATAVPTPWVGLRVVDVWLLSELEPFVGMIEKPDLQYLTCWSCSNWLWSGRVRLEPLELNYKTCLFMVSREQAGRKLTGQLIFFS